MQKRETRMKIKKREIFEYPSSQKGDFHKIKIFYFSFIERFIEIMSMFGFFESIFRTIERKKLYFFRKNLC